MNNDTFTIVNRASSLGYTPISDSFVPNIIIQSRVVPAISKDPLITIVLHYDQGYMSADHRVSMYTARGSFKLKGGSSSSGELGKLEFKTIGEGEDWEHEAIFAGKTVIRKSVANGYSVPSWGKYEIVIDDPYEFGILLNHLKRCEYRSGEAGRCYPFGFSF